MVPSAAGLNQIPFNRDDIYYIRHIDSLRSLLEDPGRALYHDPGFSGSDASSDSVLSRYRKRSVRCVTIKKGYKSTLLSCLSFLP